MIELILSTLADFGLIQEDYKHKRRIGKKEELDGTKRPMQKVFFTAKCFAPDYGFGYWKYKCPTVFWLSKEYPLSQKN